MMRHDFSMMWAPAGGDSVASAAQNYCTCSFHVTKCLIKRLAKRLNAFNFAAFKRV